MRLRAIFLLIRLVAVAPAMAGESFWSGYYIGADIGDDLAKYSRQDAVISPFGSGVVPVASAALDGMSNGDLSPSITLRLGRSFLANDWLLFGLEVEGSYQRARATSSGSHTFEGGVAGAAGNGFSYFSSDTVNSAATFDWTGALRARMGYLVAPNLLLYAAAGPTIADVTFSAQHAASYNLLEIECPFGCVILHFGGSGDNVANKERVVPGLNLAGGLEYQLTENLSLRAEYDYSQFSSMHLSMSSGAQPTPDNFKISPVLQTARLGIAYHF